MTVTIQTINWHEAMPVRHRVLWPHKPLSHCEVEGDKQAQHYGAFVDDALVGVASVYLDGRQARLRKFAILPQYQGQGIGSMMIEHMLASLAHSPVDCFWCDARESAVSFYRRFGMHTEGERFYKCDVPYFKMKLAL
ncbi:GNAT family N-acetyltransferase [Vibrio sp. CAU 1672]|uniref:GNAT family N-acetyltransferase n=1 Tax=Vibrio sp. CAU 1672 TaxID=3032594 RepID=UPI0023DCA044|nr:GNAT family N-acetyltransferase [Vibrio sp. CAU 1672]MDF2153362.1 GNAT family N-acetyltransferase [Vibrio sp. CAU 1672]